VLVWYQLLDVVTGLGMQDAKYPSVVLCGRRLLLCFTQLIDCCFAKNEK
jgi:hypothetical protein